MAQASTGFWGQPTAVGRHLLLLEDIAEWPDAAGVEALSLRSARGLIWRSVARGIATWTGLGRIRGSLGRSGNGAPRAQLEVGVKVFISSVISRMEDHRAAARLAAESLGHTVTVAEDFRASPQSPQQVCLGAVRDADAVVLVLGPRYGAPQESGISPTHEEYREARGTKPVLAFVQTGVTREPQQDRFVEEVSAWEGGGYRESFDTPESLRTAVTRALHDWELSQQAGPVDEDELMARTAALLPVRSAHAAGVAPLHVVVAGALVTAAIGQALSMTQGCVATCRERQSTETARYSIHTGGP